MDSLINPSIVLLIECLPAQNYRPIGGPFARPIGGPSSPHLSAPGTKAKYFDLHSQEMVTNLLFLISQQASLVKMKVFKIKVLDC